MAVPHHIQDDPAQARMLDEAAAELFVHELGARTVAEVLPEHARELPVVDPDATLLEVAALMARTRTPLVAVIDDHGSLLGAITLDVLLDRLVAG